MTTLVITGASGLVGTRLLARARSLPGVERVVAVGLHPPLDPGVGDEGAEVVFRRTDVTDPDAVRAAVEGGDVLVHLASQATPRDDLARMRRVNVDGTRHVVEAAAATGARKVVVVSTTAVYGAHADNDVPLTEESPLRANPDLPFVEHRREAEQWVTRWAEDHPDVVVTILRPAQVVGPGVRDLFTHAMLLPRLPSVRGHRPPFQFLHLDDYVSALVHVVDHDLPGPYNVAAEGWLSFDELEAILGRRALDIPEEIAFTLVDRLAAFGLTGFPVGAVHHLVHPWVVSVDRLVATGWRPMHSNRDAAAHLAEDLGDRVELGPVTTTRRQVRQTAAVSLGVAGGLLALGVLARRRGGRAPEGS